jgi:hypothetical protein
VLYLCSLFVLLTNVAATCQIYFDTDSGDRVYNSAW